MTLPRLGPGQVIANRYSVKAPLGEGGSSISYRAATAQGSEVVLRILDSAVSQRADVMQAVQQSIAGTNALPADMVAHVLDVGYDQATGSPYTARELVTLPSLAKAAAGRPLSPEAALKMLQALARTLDAAHPRQVFHHAIKPTNVFVEPGAPHAPRLTDFGAGIIRSAVPTGEGYGLAAPWIAPEQVQQGVPPPSVGADVFSLALLVFFAMTGRSYWRSCQGAQPDIGSWQREVLGPRTAVSARAGELGLRLPGSLDAVFARALSVDPGERFRSAGELAVAFAGTLGMGTGAATMALPASAFQPPQGYAPPAPAMPQAAPAQPPAPAAPSYGGSQNIETVRPPQLTDLAPRAVPASSKVVPIALIIAAVVIVSSLVAGFLIWKAEPATAPTGPIAIGADSANAAGSGSPTAGGIAVPTSTTTAAQADAAPPTSASAEPADAGPDPDADTPLPTDVEVKLTCVPACEELKVDGKAVTDLNAPLLLPPGKHQIAVGKPGFLTQSDTITLEAGKLFEKEYVLKAPGAFPKSTGTAKAPCGKFLKRCD